MTRPTMRLDPSLDLDGYAMVDRAASILTDHGLEENAMEIHQRATIEGYETYLVYRLLKEYMDI